jgi:hypothetical protein
MTRKRHMVLRPRLIVEMRQERMRGDVAAAKALSYPLWRYRMRQDAFDKADAHYSKAEELARLAGVQECGIVAGEVKA